MRILKRIGLSLVVMLLLADISEAQNLSPLRQVINRVCPWMSGKYVLRPIPRENGKDVFELSTQNGKLIIAASGIPAGGMGFNWYLEKYCHRFYSLTGSNLAPVSALPEIEGTVKQMSPYRYRYFLNYCTLNYSMSFWGPREWERGLDWMALNGINLALMTNGMEKVWLNTLTHFGYTQQEALMFIPGPAFEAWWLMGNLEGWGGPVLLSMVDERSKTEQFILKRMRELQIEPVLQGFYGMVPYSLMNHYPKARIVEQGKWVNIFRRPPILMPGDSLFKAMAAVYYKEMKKLYGEVRFYGGEPFHEGGRREGITEQEVAHAVYSEMKKQNPQAVWVLQGWSGNPSKELLKGLKKEEALVLDLFGEGANNWEIRDGYEQHNWVWCSVSNFGEKTGLYGRFDRLATEPARALSTSAGKTMVGIGAMPEGMLNNPVYFDLHYRMGWTNQPVNVSEWLHGYVQSRYGWAPQSVEEAWTLLQNSVYKSNLTDQEGAVEAIICARPSLNITSVSSCGNTKFYYDPSMVEAALKKFMEASDELGNVDAYQYDLVDIARQVLANRGRALYKKMQDAFAQKDLEGFKVSADKFLSVLQQEEELLSTRREFMLGTWIAQSRALGKTVADKNLLERNARAQITYWGPDNPATELHEYAHKEWAGLLSGLYLPRWKVFILECELALKENRDLKPIDFFSMEAEWVSQRDTYPVIPLGNSVKMVKKIFRDE